MLGADIRKRHSVILIVLWSFSMPLQAQLEESDGFRSAMTSIVMIRGMFPDETPTYGAGIIFGASGPKFAEVLYVATANHVVRRGSSTAENVRVLCTQLQREWLSARVLAQPVPTLDLAVLEVANLAGRLRRESLTLDILSEEKPQRGHKVHHIGYLGGRPWEMNLTADVVSRVSRDQIFFQSSFIGPGQSGGGLVTTGGKLLGMVTAAAPPEGIALRIESVVAALAPFDYPVQLATAPPGSMADFASSSNRHRRPTARPCFTVDIETKRGTMLRGVELKCGPKDAGVLLTSNATIRFTDQLPDIIEGIFPQRLLPFESISQIEFLVMNEKERRAVGNYRKLRSDHFKRQWRKISVKFKDGVTWPQVYIYDNCVFKSSHESSKLESVNPQTLTFRPKGPCL